MGGLGVGVNLCCLAEQTATPPSMLCTSMNSDDGGTSSCRSPVTFEGMERCSAGHMGEPHFGWNDT